MTDNGYTLNWVARDTSLQFKERTALNRAAAYWLKLMVNNPNKVTRKDGLFVQPNLDYTLFYFAPIKGRQVADRAEILPYKQNSAWVPHSLELQGGYPNSKNLFNVSYGCF